MKVVVDLRGSFRIRSECLEGMTAGESGVFKLKVLVKGARVVGEAVCGSNESSGVVGKEAEENESEKGQQTESSSARRLPMTATIHENHDHGMQCKRYARRNY